MTCLGHELVQLPEVGEAKASAKHCGFHLRNNEKQLSLELLVLCWEVMVSTLETFHLNPHLLDPLCGSLRKLRNHTTHHV